MSPSENSSPRLVVIEGKDKGKIFLLKAGTMIIGRSKADITIHDPRISRSHVSLEYDSKTGRLDFKDLKSLNGTIVNESVIENGQLKDGDKLQIGNTIFDCQLGVSEATIPAESRFRRAPKENKENTEKSSPPKIQSEEQKKSPPPRKKEPALEKNENLLDIEDKKPTQLRMDNLYQRVPKKARLAVLVFALFAFYALTKSPSTPAPKVDSDSEITKIKNLMKEGKKEEAYQAAKQLIKENPEDALSQYVFADVTYSQNKLEEAINALRKAHTLPNKIPLIHVRLAKAFYRGGLVNEAMEELKHINELLKGEEINNKDFVIQTTILLTELKTNPERIIELAKLLQTTLAKDSAIGYKIEANLLLDLKRPQEAIKVIEQGLAIEPRDELLFEKLSFAKLSDKDLAGALKTLEDWIQINPRASKPLLVLAYLKFNDREYLAALPYVRAVTQILANNEQDPDFAEAVHLTGKIYLEQNQKVEASQSFQRACALGFQESCSALQNISYTSDQKNNSPASVTELPQENSTSPNAE